jgi:hypothetical protein
MQIGKFIHCFFSSGDKENNTIGVMTTVAGYPFRVINGEFAKTCVGKYFNTSPRYFTWKLWETNLIQELDENLELSHFRPEVHKTICEYLVMAKNKWIEIIDCAPEWEVHRNIKVEKLVEQYTRKRHYE